jgi:ribosomal protein S18 acetylase RimI-like enzyme
MSNFIIREISSEDYAGIYPLNLDLGYDFPAEKIQNRINCILSGTHDKIFIAEQDGLILGYIHISPYELIYEDSLLNILGVVVKKEYRRTGIGTQLLVHAESYGKAHGYKGIRLVSGIDRTDAHHFYISHGYTNRKDQKNFIKRF